MTLTLDAVHGEEPLKQCFLLDLPAELRLNIYNYVFQNEDLTREIGRAHV